MTGMAGADGELRLYAGDVIGVLSGIPAPEGFGELQLHSGPEGIVIDRADPIVRLAGELVRRQFGEPAGPGHRGTRLAVTGVNRRVVYVIGGYHGPDEDGPDGPDGDGADWYEAAWPD